MTKICAIVPTFNRANYIEEALDSILSQTRPVDEIIVVNDGATDNTMEVLAKYKDKIKIIDKPNSGKAASLNMAISQTNADYIWIVDDDDLAAPNGLKALVDILNGGDKYNFVFGFYKTFADSDIKYDYIESCSDKDAKIYDPVISFLRGVFTFQGAMLIKREKIIEIGGYNATLIRSQDTDLSIKLFQLGNFASTKEDIFYQRYHNGSRGASSDTFSNDKSLAKWFEYDKIIFDWVRENYSFSQFTPNDAKEFNEAAKHRVTLLQQIAIYANHGKWQFVIEDLEKLKSCYSEKLLPLEQDILKNYAYKYLTWLDIMHNKEIIHKISNYRKQSTLFKYVIWNLTRPLLWVAKLYLKDNKYKLAFKHLLLFFKINYL